MKKLCILLALSALLSLPASAGWFGKSDEPKAPAAPANRKYVLQVPDKKTEKELLDLFQAKGILTEDVTVLLRLEKQRVAKLDAVNGILREQFAVEPDLKYAYDAGENAVYALTFKEGVAEGKAAPERVLHRMFDKAEDGLKFVKLMEAKDNAATEAKVFAIVGRERMEELKKVDDLLKNKFNLKTGRLYNYDDKTMTLYEIVPLKAGQLPPK